MYVSDFPPERRNASFAVRTGTASAWALAGGQCSAVAASPFAIDARRVGQRVVLAVTGEIDMLTAPSLSAAIGNAQPCHELWVDLSNVSFMDSTGIPALVQAQRTLREAPHSFAVICPPGPVRRVFELSGVDGQMVLFPHRSAANGRAGAAWTDCFAVDYDSSRDGGCA
jgi:anti-sigma B factor antagonist